MIAHLTSIHWRIDTRISIKECAPLANYGYHTALVVADGICDELSQAVAVHDGGASKSWLDRIRNAPGLEQADIFLTHNLLLSLLIFVLLKY